MDAVIFIKGAWAELRGAPAAILTDTLTFLHPERANNRAYREERWDGTVPLYETRKFPAGLTDRVVEACKQAGHTVRVLGWKPTPVDLSRFTPEYLPGITLRPHQYDLCLSMLTNQRMSGKSPTRSGKTECYLATARYLWEELGWKSLVVVPKKGLLDQTYRRALKYYGDDIPIGRLGDGWRTFGVLNIATAQTLIGFAPHLRKGRVVVADPELRDLVLHGHDALFIDEGHRTKAEMWYTCAMSSPAKFRIALSGTPLTNQDLYDAKMMGATGPLLYEYGANDLVDAGYASKPKIAMILAPDASAPMMDSKLALGVNAETNESYTYRKYPPYDEAYRAGVVDSVRHNQTVIRAVEWMVDHKRGTVILCRLKKHFRTLEAMLKESGIPFRAVWGDHAVEERNHAKKLLAGKNIKVLLATTIFDEGEDLPGADAVVLAEGVKSQINAVQRIGRGMMLDKGGPSDVWIVDVVPVCHPTLVAHGLERCKAYEAEGHEVRVVEAWPNDDAPGFDYDSLLPFLSWASDPVAA